MTAKNIFKIAGLTALSFIAGGLMNLYEFTPKAIKFRDMDEDGREDILIETRNNEAAHVFLERDGQYIRLEDLSNEENYSKRKAQYNIAELKSLRMER